MDDVFEDVQSVDEFSDVEDEAHDDQTALSDDEIARMLGLMDDPEDDRMCGSRVVPPAVEETRARITPPQPRPCERVAVEQVLVSRSSELQSPTAEASDFDRLLADFTRQQTFQTSTLPQQNESVDRPLKPTMSMQVSAPLQTPSNSPSALKSVPVRPCENATTAFEALLAKDSAVRETAAKTGSVSQLKWGIFTPDKMPPRREFESLRAAKSPRSSSKETPPKRLKVVVPSVAYLRTKNVRFPQSSEPSNKDWTFRPTINKAYYRRRGMARLRGKTTTRFTARMQQDISEREERHRRREVEKRRQEESDARLQRQRRRSLVTKGSQAILERNGLWKETLEDRLQRLLKRSTGQPKSSKDSSSATRSRKRDKLREKEVAKARACESLYRRGVDKLQRARDESAATPLKSPDRRSSRRSDSIVRERLERDVRMICGHETGPEQGYGVSPGSQQARLPSSVSFVEFSCVLLYFGFVPAPNTPWEGDAQVSLLWHAWITYAEGDGEARRVRMAELKHLLESVIVKHHQPSGSVRREFSQDPKARLLEVFRLNYIARKRPRGVSGEHKGGAERNGNKRHSHKTKVVTYTIHGKAIEPTETPCDLLAVRHSLAQQRVEAMRREKEQEELAECTFKPRISSVTAKDSLTSYRFREVDDASVSTEPEAFDRLYNDAFARHNNTMTQYFRARQEEEEKCKKEMRVSPTYVNGLTIEERLERLHESLSNNALPVHFHEKIAEMRHAYASKIEDAREKMSRLEPAHVFPRSRDGHTIVVPFKFATQQRMKESRRKGVGTKSLLRHDLRETGSTSAILRKMRLHYAPPKETSHVEADEDGVEADSEAADLCIDVHVSPFETFQLSLNRGDDVYEATKAFADAYNLDGNQQKQLLRHAEAKLEELFDL